MMEAMFEAEIAAAWTGGGQARRGAGPRCATARAAARSPWAVGGCRWARPRARTLEGREVALSHLCALCRRGPAD